MSQPHGVATSYSYSYYSEEKEKEKEEEEESSVRSAASRFFFLPFFLPFFHSFFIFFPFSSPLSLSASLTLALYPLPLPALSFPRVGLPDPFFANALANGFSRAQIVDQRFFFFRLLLDFILFSFSFESK